MRGASVAATALASIVRFYQLAHRGRLPNCRYLPTCSAYALEAVESHGALRGSWFAVRRLARCHPWGGSGWDPVPPAPTAQLTREAHLC